MPNKEGEDVMINAPQEGIQYSLVTKLDPYSDSTAFWLCDLGLYFCKTEYKQPYCMELLWQLFDKGLKST